MLTLDQIKEKTKELCEIWILPEDVIKHTVKITCAIDYVQYDFYLTFYKSQLIRVTVKDEDIFHEYITENWFSNNKVNIKCNFNPFTNSYINRN